MPVCIPGTAFGMCGIREGESITSHPGVPHTVSTGISEKYNHSRGRAIVKCSVCITLNACVRRRSVCVYVCVISVSTVLVCLGVCSTMCDSVEC